MADVFPIYSFSSGHFPGNVFQYLVVLTILKLSSLNHPCYLLCCPVWIFFDWIYFSNNYTCYTLCKYFWGLICIYIYIYIYMFVNYIYIYVCKFFDLFSKYVPHISCLFCHAFGSKRSLWFQEDYGLVVFLNNEIYFLFYM